MNARHRSINIRAARRPASAVLAVASSVLLVVGLVGLLGHADAASPPNGTVTSTSTTANWTGGGFTSPSNPSAQLGTPTCDAADPCDNFSLGVNVPAGYETSHSLVIGVTWTNANDDFDVYLVNSSGSVVASAASSDRPEVITTAPNAGTYTVRVVPFSVVPGDTFTARAALVTGATATATGTPTTPTTPDPSAARFTDYAAPASVGGNDLDNAGEPSIGNNFKTGATMYQASLSTYKVLFDDATTPATAAWSDVSATVANGCAAGSTTSLDPILFTDHQTGRTFQSQLTGVNSATCYTDDDGVSWQPSTGGGVPSGVDHQTIGGGAYSPTDVVPKTGTYPNAVYYCSQDIASAFCAASHDGGTTFTQGNPIYTVNDCSGIHGHVKVAPDGTVYVPNKNCGGMQAAVVSTNGGLSWTISKVPGSTAPSTTTSASNDPAVGIGRNGTVYFGYVGANGLPSVATSTDRGATWKYGQAVGTEYGIKNGAFPVMVAGDDDRAAFAYLGTPTAGNPGATTFAGVWHLYVDYTYDGGKTWVTSDATPNDPVQRGIICTAGTSCLSGRNLLDFNDITTDITGRVLVGFADGCIKDCVTNPSGTSADAYSSIARQTTGRTLFAKYDAPGSTTSTSASASSTATSTATGTATSTATTTATTTATSTATTTATSTATTTATATTTTTTTATATATATSHPRQPNLTVYDVRVHLKNGRFYTRVYIRNTGNTTIKKFETYGYDNGVMRMHGGRFTLRPGQTVVRFIHWKYDGSVARHELVYTVDPRGLVKETNESDNSLTRIVRVPPS